MLVTIDMSAFITEIAPRIHASAHSLKYHERQRLQSGKEKFHTLLSRGKEFLGREKALFSEGHWFLSLMTIAALASGALGLQQTLTGETPPFSATLACALAAGAAVTASFERWNPFGHLSFTAVLLAAAAFLSYAGYVLVAARLGPWSMAFALLLFVLQAGALALLLAHTFEILDVVCRTSWERAAGRKAVPGYAPKVSLHVPTHREPPELVIETLDALARLNYPDYEVLVVDNNTADEDLWRPVEEHCARLGPRFRFFHLMPWPGYKSGALNFALRQTAPGAEIVGVVDADYLVEPNYLADLVGHFADARVAFVQTPQDYRDGDGRGLYGKALALAYLYFFRISMVSRNERNGIIFAGTMGLLRKTALEEVGGWDEWCITEDAEVSLRLLDVGHESVYIDRTYGRGIMPLDYAGLKKQRFRWAFGGMQLLRMHAGKLFNPWAKGKLTAVQRLAYLAGGASCAPATRGSSTRTAPGSRRSIWASVSTAPSDDSKSIREPTPRTGSGRGLELRRCGLLVPLVDLRADLRQGIPTLQALGKPIMINEFGTLSSGGDPATTIRLWPRGLRHSAAAFETNVFLPGEPVAGARASGP